MVKMKFFANLRDLVKKKEIDVEASMVKDAIDTASSLLGIDLESELFDGEIPKKGVIVLVNGRNIEHLKGIYTPLQEGDVISLFPPVGGG